MEQPVNPLVVRGGVAGREHPRGPSEGVHFQARIVGQGPLTRELGHGLGFEAGIGQVGAAGFFNVQPLWLLAQVQIHRIEHGPDLGHLVGVATGNHQHRSLHGVTSSIGPL